MITLPMIDRTARSHGLAVRGVLHPQPDECLPENTKTLILLGPDEPAFWPIFSSSAEFQDDQMDPMDRWSKRICNILASDWSGTALFPSDGPPYPPFPSWATQSEHAWSSPVGLLVHHQAGLFISYRCAIALYALVEPTTAPEQPCSACNTTPCKTACPVSAIAPGQDYNVATCKAHMRSFEGETCRTHGCLVRRACPVSENFSRLEAQSAFHMAAFLKS